VIVYGYQLRLEKDGNQFNMTKIWNGSKGGLIKAWIDGVELEDKAFKQIENVASLPFIHKHVAIMPDAHWGMGCTIGSVIATKKAIIPASVGVDLSCGLLAVQTTLTASDMPDSLHELRIEIEKSVPHGRTNDGGIGDRGAWGNPNQTILDTFKSSLHDELKMIVDLDPKLGKHAFERAPYQLGTLGTGNHFIEICTDESQNIWIMLHSGSRGIGNKIGTYFIEKAKKEMERWFIHLPDIDLAYLPEGSVYFERYMNAVKWAHQYATINRKIMMDNTIDALKIAIKKPFDIINKAINCHHNYINEERHFGEKVFVTRKGAVRAQEGDLGIIPGSMGAKSFIVRGKGNRESFNSCSHGAGRLMSRTAARKKYTIEDHIQATMGVECRQDVDVIDETPGAYKDIDMVMKAQGDLVDIVHTLKQIVCVKG